MYGIQYVRMLELRATPNKKYVRMQLNEYVLVPTRTIHSLFRSSCTRLASVGLTSALRAVPASAAEAAMYLVTKCIYCIKSPLYIYAHSSWHSRNPMHMPSD